MEPFGVTLIGVGSRNVAATTREAACKIVSVALFARAYEAGISITRTWVDEQLDRLRSHPQPCRCCEPCDLAAMTTGNKVHWTASGWMRQYRRAGVLVRR